MSIYKVDKNLKVIIELEFDTYTPTTKDIIDYINELGVDLDYKIIGQIKND